MELPTGTDRSHGNADGSRRHPGVRPAAEAGLTGLFSSLCRHIFSLLLREGGLSLTAKEPHFGPSAQRCFAEHWEIRRTSLGLTELNSKIKASGPAVRYHVCVRDHRRPVLSRYGGRAMSRGQRPVTEQEVNQRFSRRSPASGPPSPPRMTMSWGEQPAPARGRPGVRIKNPEPADRGVQRESLPIACHCVPSR